MARSFSVSLLIAALSFALPLAVAARANAAQSDHPYASDNQPGPSTGDYNTPEADGRPGEYYFQLGVNAFYKKDYAHAVAMYKVAASWAYKPAEFNLGLMYFKGAGVGQDRALGAAWMVLAAERPGSKYAKTRDVMITALSDAEFTRTNSLWNELKSTYGDEVALHRAKARWAQVKSSMTGSRVGDGAVYLTVGAGNGVAGPPILQPLDPKAPKSPQATSGWGLFHGGQTTDGSIAYQQFHTSDNPYDPRFLKGWVGTATVGPLMPVSAGDASSQSSGNDGHEL
jgi:hypothetical protein